MRKTARALSVLTVLAVLWCGGLLIYGFTQFPTSPIRPHGDGYRDKHGNARTAAEYEAFLHWKRMLFRSVGVTVGLGIGLSLVTPRRRDGQLTPDEAETLARANRALDGIVPPKLLDEIRSSTRLGDPTADPRRKRP